MPDSDGIALHYERIGDGPRLLYCNGSGTTVDSSRPLLEKLSAGFELLDITDMQRTREHSLAWFYVTYLHRDYAALRSNTHWSDEANDAVVAHQNQRRADLLARIDALVAKINAQKRGG